MAKSIPRRDRIEPVLGKPRAPAEGDIDIGVGDEDRAVFGRSRARGSDREEADESERPSRARRAARGRRRRSGSGLFRFVRAVVKWGIVLAVWGGVALAVGIVYFASQLPSSTDWSVLPKRPPNIKILANDGSLIANRGDTGGEFVRIDDLPAYLPQAVVAIEDRRFYDHFGIDPVGLARAAFVNARAGTVVQGGSTLTQQLAKNLFLTPDRTFKRKLQEAMMAVWLELKYSKRQILEAYLNRVYLGAGAYGVDAAARRYFGKSARAISLKEAAILAALLKAPSRYAPTSDPAAANERADLVLSAMQEEGFITADQQKKAAAVAVVPPSEGAGGGGLYVADWVADLVPDVVGALDKDVIVETTIDAHLEEAAAHAVSDVLGKSGAKYGVSQGALVAIDGTGAVRALVGGRDYQKSQFNRAVEAKRQPGSAFKPFVYLTALEFGLTPDTVRIDQPTRIGKWEPKNYEKRYLGPVTLQTALAESINTVAVQLANEVGPSGVVATAHRLGIKSELQPNPSIALGTSEVNLLELTDAYVPFANDGYAVPPYVIAAVKSVDGKVLYQRPHVDAVQVIDPVHVGMMNTMLSDTLARGTGRKAAIAGWPAAGKTGTTNDSRDAWFVGYTANLTAGVWLGNDDFKPTKRMTGGSLPAEIWNRFMVDAHQGVAVAALPGDYSFRAAQQNGAQTAGPGAALPQTQTGGPIDTAVTGSTPPAGTYFAAADPERGDGAMAAPQDDPGYAANGYAPARREPAGGNAVGGDTLGGDFDAGGPVPPADIGAASGRRLPPDQAQPRHRGGFLQNIFGGG